MEMTVWQAPLFLPSSVHAFRGSHSGPILWVTETGTEWVGSCLSY